MVNVNDHHNFRFYFTIMDFTHASSMKFVDKMSRASRIKVLKSH